MSDREIILEGYTRVSDILSPFSGYGAVPKHILNEACERGDTVHKIAEAYIKDLLPTEENALKGYIHSFLEWKGDKKIVMPSRFYNKSLMITGKIDGIYMNETGDYTLFDLKTSAKEGKMWEYQGAAYKYLTEVEGCYVINRIEFIRLPKDGSSAEVFDYPDIYSTFCEFTEMVKFYHKFFAKNKSVKWEDI